MFFRRIWILLKQNTDTRKIQNLSVSEIVTFVRRKRIRDAALYTFVYHYTFAAKSKSLII